MLNEVKGRHVLLLQGPMGPFFRRLADEMEAHGARVSKINFNAGDALFFPGRRTHAYRGTLEAWPDYVAGFIRDQQVDIVVLFGDQRPYHEQMLTLTTRLGVRLYVFEEGYLRPNYLTLELGGVNGRSSTPRTAGAFDGMPSKALPEPKSPLSGYYHSVVHAIFYHIAMTLFAWRYPRCRHHRPVNAVNHALGWIRGAIRLYWFRLKERKVAKRLCGGADAGRFFLVPLQVRNDFQLTCWSDYSSVEGFIDEVAASFAAHAEPGDKLVFKHHPMDRAYNDYSRYMKQVAKRTGLGDRLVYVHDVPMPRLLDHARGVVCVNSTSGISALHHGVPVRTMGNAIYNISGLVSEQPLDRFWREPGEVDRALFHRFRNWLLLHNQLHGSFYRRITGANTPTAIVWNPVQLPERLPAVEPSSKPAARAEAAPAPGLTAGRT